MHNTYKELHEINKTLNSMLYTLLILCFLTMLLVSTGIFKNEKFDGAGQDNKIHTKYTTRETIITTGKRTEIHFTNILIHNINHKGKVWITPKIK